MIFFSVLSIVQNHLCYICITTHKKLGLCFCFFFILFNLKKSKNIFFNNICNIFHIFIHLFYWLASVPHFWRIFLLKFVPITNKLFYFIVFFMRGIYQNSHIMKKIEQIRQNISSIPDCHNFWFFSLVVTLVSLRLYISKHLHTFINIYVYTYM